MAKGGSNINKRFGGRWIKDGEQYKERNKTIKAVLNRFVYLLFPFLGIMCAHDTYVRPDVEDNKSITNHERKIMLDRKDDLRGRISAIETQILSVETTIDTLHQPYVTYYEGVIDSLVTIRSGYDQSLPLTKAKIDSLTEVRDEILADNDRLSQVFREKSAHFTGLEEWNVALIDSVAHLDNRIALLTDDYFRASRPREYKRREALFTGPGDYPNRDEIPVRETDSSGGK